MAAPDTTGLTVVATYGGGTLYNNGLLYLNDIEGWLYLYDYSTTVDHGRTFRWDDLQSDYPDAYVIVMGTTRVIVDESVTSLVGGAFLGFPNLTTVEIQNGVQEIGYEAFSCCPNLTSVTIPGSVTSVGGEAFSYCDGLTSIVFPEGVQYFGDYLFRGCANLRTVSFPASLISGYAPFYDCSSVSEIRYAGTYAQWRELNFWVENDDIRIRTSDGIFTRDGEPATDPTESNQAEYVKMLSESEPANYHSIAFFQGEFGDVFFDTWTNYHLVPSSRPSVAPPEPKTSFLNVPGADGSLDFTEVLDSKVHYGQRTGSWEFYVVHEEIENYNWAELWKTLLADLHGKRVKLALVDEKDMTGPWYYYGRVWLNAWQSDASHSRVVLNYNLEPYRYRSDEARESKEGGIL